VLNNNGTVNTQQAARWFTFQDEMKFEKTGQPTGGGVSVDRPGTYCCTYLARRPRSSSSSQTEVYVIVYAGRPTDQISGEVACAAVVQSSTEVSITYPGDKPNLRKGGWIMDATYSNNGAYGSITGYCYQVAAVTDTGANTMTLELESPLRPSMLGSVNVNTIVVLENVITVLDRGTSWRP
jgi:hypothetical protein